MGNLSKGEVRSKHGHNAYRILGPFTGQGTVAALDLVAINTSNRVQIAVANDAEVLGWALAGYVDGDTDVYVIDGRDAEVVMGVTGTTSSITLGVYYAIGGTTGAFTIDQGDQGNDCLVATEVDTTNSLALVAIIDAAQQLSGKETTLTED